MLSELLDDRYWVRLKSWREITDRLDHSISSVCRWLRLGDNSLWQVARRAKADELAERQRTVVELAGVERGADSSAAL